MIATPEQALAIRFTETDLERLRDLQRHIMQRWNNHDINLQGVFDPSPTDGVIEALNAIRDASDKLATALSETAEAFEVPLAQDSAGEKEFRVVGAEYPVPLDHELWSSCLSLPTRNVMKKWEHRKLWFMSADGEEYSQFFERIA